MRSHTVYRTFNTDRRREFIRITEDVADAVREADIEEGMVLVCAMHITAAVWINDDEPGLQADVLEWLDKVAPPSWKEPANDVARELLPDPGDYRHHRGGEDNGDAHLKNLLVHHQVIVPVTARWVELSQRKGQALKPFKEEQTAGSAIFAPDSLAGQAALVTGGGTNLGKAAAAELLRRTRSDRRPPPGGAPGGGRRARPGMRLALRRCQGGGSGRADRGGDAESPRPP